MSEFKQRPGMGVVEILIIVAVLIVIGALAYFALAPKSSTTSNVSLSPATSPNASYSSVDEVKSAQAELDKEDGSDVQKDVDSLTADLNAL